MKKQIQKIPVIGKLATSIYRRFVTGIAKPEGFPGSETYWERRYASGGNSGTGSYEKFAQFKAEIINGFVDKHAIKSVIEFGCGDGNQLTLANYPSYIGLDVSQTAVDSCLKKFSSDPSKKFMLTKERGLRTADLSLSLDVIYHLIEDSVFFEYMDTLFASADRFVIIYSSNVNESDGYEGEHVRHRKFTEWVDGHLKDWHQIEVIPNRYPYDRHKKTGSFADFYIYRRN